MSFDTIVSEFEVSRYADKFIGLWESHPCHEDSLSLRIYPNGEVMLTGTVPRYNKRSMRRALLPNQTVSIDQTFIIKNCEYAKGSIQCVLINRDEKEARFILCDDHLIFGNYHLYKDTSIQHMAQEKSVRESRRSLRLSDIFGADSEDIAVEFEKSEKFDTPNRLVVSNLTLHERNSFTLGENMFEKLCIEDNCRNSYTLGEKFTRVRTESTAAFTDASSLESVDSAVTSGLAC